VSYPYLLERSPGELWVTTMQGGLEARLSETDYIPAEIRIVCLGDSITKGARLAGGSAGGIAVEQTFCSRVQAMFREKGVNVKVINAGVGSDRTDGALLRMDQHVLIHKPQFVAIMFGTNDSCYDIGKTGPRISIKAYERNLREMAAKVRSAGAQPVIMTEPPMGLAWLAPKRNPVYAEKGLNYALALYMEAARRVASDTKTPLIDHFAQWEKASDADVDSWLTDGCHPNAAGHEILARSMMRTLWPLVIGETSRASR
jgi:lysophospholipase L1-like esterase